MQFEINIEQREQGDELSKDAWAVEVNKDTRKAGEEEKGKGGGREKKNNRG